MIYIMVTTKLHFYEMMPSLYLTHPRLFEFL